MKRAFTLIEVAIVVAIIAIIAAIAIPNLMKAEEEAAAKSPAPAKFTSQRVDGAWDGPTLWVITDPATGQRWLVAGNGNGVAMSAMATPAPKAGPE